MSQPRGTIGAIRREPKRRLHPQSFDGTIFAKENGTAFINLPRGIQVWLPSRGLRVGDNVRVWIEVRP